VRTLAAIAVGLAVGFAAGWLVFSAAGERTDTAADGAWSRPDGTVGREERADAASGSQAAPAAATSAGAPRREAPPTTLTGVPIDQLTARDRAWIRDGVERAYRQYSSGQQIPAEELDWAVEAAGGSIRGAPAAYANQAWRREQFRAVEGTLGEPPVVLFQLRTSQRLEVSLGLDPTDRWTASFRRKEPLATTPLDRGEKAFRLVGGVIPGGRTFVVESIAVDATWGSAAATHGERFLEINADPWTEIRLPGVGRRVSAGYEGRVLLDAGNERYLVVEASGCVAEVRVSGRLLPTAEARALAKAPFLLARSDGEGFLTGDPVLLQVVADHGGGNPRTLHLDGSDNGRFHEMADRALWDDREDLKTLSRSRGYAERAGAIPPGKSFEVERVTWRARLLEGDSHSDVEITIAGKKVVDVSGKQDPNPRGTWTGSVVLAAGKERELSVTAHYHGMVEAWVYGRLIDRAAR
jgi:hypothetical protein